MNGDSSSYRHTKLPLSTSFLTGKRPAQPTALSTPLQCRLVTRSCRVWPYRRQRDRRHRGSGYNARAPVALSSEAGNRELTWCYW